MCHRPLAGAAFVVLLSFLAVAPAIAEPSVVVAVDTSRSLQPATLAAMGEAAAAALGRLPARTQVGVLAFDDAPHWVLAAGSPQQAATALASLAPTGSYTLLDDALFTAARALAPGGVVLLLTDGRDENSATTVEDVARACEARGVRILALGAGERMDERTLRRLALLTGGGYLGTLATSRAGAAGEALAAAAAARPIATVRSSSPPPAPARGAAEPVPARRAATGTAPAAAHHSEPATAGTLAGTAPGDPAGRAPAPTGGRRWWWLALPLALVAVTVPAATWASRRGRQRTTICRRCGSEVPAGGDCPRCAALESEMALQERLRSRDLTRLEDASELRLENVRELDTSAVDLDSIEKTRVIADQSMLMVREPGESQRSFLLRADGAFAVGRDPRSNTITLRDPALSARHFKVVPDDGRYYVVDLDSTNGTYLNRRRVRAARLASGDLIQAGQIELEFRSFLSQVA